MTDTPDYDIEQSLRDELKSRFEIGRHRLTLKEARLETHPDCRVEVLEFGNEAGEPVRGLLTRPLSPPAGRLPAVLYIHAHGHRYDIGADELLSGRPKLVSALGPVLAQKGLVVLCIDLACFGTRQIPGESALAKALLWHGHTLAGRMLGELDAALLYLAARPDVDPGRIAAFGMSMGATFSYWLAAVEPRLAAVAQLCCFADFASLIATGAHDGHGIYLTIPGLLDLAGNGTIAGLVAPRPQFIGLGATDPLTPPAAVALALAETRAAYENAGVPERLEVLIDPDSGHEETPAMRRHLLDFFRRHLGSAG